MADLVPGTRVSAGQRARLLRQVLAADLPGRDGVPAKASAPQPATAPASYAQEQLWFLDQLAPGTANYNIPFAFFIEGPLDPTALREALAATTRRHDSLRMALRPAAGGLTQVVSPSVDLPLTTVDLTGAADPRDEAWSRCRALAAEPIGLGEAPLWRAWLMRLSQARHVLLWVASHAVADGWSVGLLMRELSAGYRAARRRLPIPLAEPRSQFTAYARRQRELLTPGRIADLADFWRRALDGCPPLDFPFDHPRPAVASARGATHAFGVPAVTADGVRAIARRLGVTPFTILLAAYHALLARYCAITDVAVGTPVAGRDAADADDVMGSLVNTVAVRADSADDPTFATFAARIAGVLASALAHQDLPFGLLVERLRPPRDGRYNPICQTVFSFGSTPLSAAAYALDDDVMMRFSGISNGTVRFDLELAVDDGPAGWTGRLEYATDLIEPPTASRLCERYLRLLSEAVADPDRRLSCLAAPAAPARARTAPPGPAILVRGQHVAAEISAWADRQPSDGPFGRMDPSKLWRESCVSPPGLAAMSDAARFLSRQMGLRGEGILRWDAQPSGLNLLFAAMLAMRAEEERQAGGRGCQDGAATVAAWLVSPDRASGPPQPPQPTAPVLLLSAEPAIAPAWAVRAHACTWAVTLPADVPGAVLGRPVRQDEDRMVVGRPLPGTLAEVLDAAGNPALPGTVGWLRLAFADSAPAGGPTLPRWRVHDLGGGLLATPGRAFEARAPAPASSPPADELVSHLLGMWRDALGTDEAGLDDDFFVLGGHSLLASELVARIREELGCEFSVAEFFSALTVREIAGLLAERTAGGRADGIIPDVPADLLTLVEGLTDAEVTRMLRETKNGTQAAIPGAD